MKSTFSLLLALLFLTSSLISIKPVFSEEISETKWVLETIIIGEGGKQEAPEGTRGEGSYREYTVTEQGITYHDRVFDHHMTEDFVDAIFSFTLPEFPQEIQVGETVIVTATGSGSGYMRQSYYGVVLSFYSDYIQMTGTNSAGVEVHGDYGPYINIDIDHESWNGESYETISSDIPDSESITVQFTAPECGWNKEFSIGVFLWGGLDSHVEWVYTCIEAEPEYGVIEKNGELHLISPPEGVLEISLSDLPLWAQPQMVTVGANAVCVGSPDTVSTGDSGVLIDGLAVARLGDSTAHGGVIVEGSEKIFVNGVPAAFIGGFHSCPMVFSTVPHIGGPIYYSPTHEHLSESIDEWIVNQGDDIPVTILSMDAKQGTTILEIDGKDIQVGDTVMIGNDSDHVDAAVVIEKGSLIIDRPLFFDHPAGNFVTVVPDDYAMLVLSTVEEVAVNVSDDLVVEERGIPGFPVYTITLAIFLFVALRMRRKKNIIYTIQ